MEYYEMSFIYGDIARHCGDDKIFMCLLCLQIYEEKIAQKYIS